MCQSTNSYCQEALTDSVDRIGYYEDHILEVIRNLTKNSEIESHNILTVDGANNALNKVRSLMKQIQNEKIILRQIATQMI